MLSAPRSLALILLQVVISVPLMSQEPNRCVLAGHVRDGENGEPVPGANVFLASTTRGTSTSDGGAFTLRSVPMGIYDLVVSLVGYERRVTHLEIVKPESLYFDIRIKARAYQLGEVNVIGKSAERWRDNLRKFTDAFVGETGHSGECTILNPEVLNLQTHGDTLIASADSVLHVDNRALGYRLDIDLASFSWDVARDNGYFLTYTRFREMPQAAGDSARWAENRERAFRGSMKHFLKALYSDNLEAERFTLSAGSLKNLIGERGHQVSAGDLQLDSLPGTGLKSFRFFGYLRVDYGKERTEDIGYEGQRRQRQVPTIVELTAFSIISMKHAPAFIDSSGNLFDPLSIEVSGSWARNRLAEALPLH
jgi:hypothetical protein